MDEFEKLKKLLNEKKIPFRWNTDPYQSQILVEKKNTVSVIFIPGRSYGAKEGLLEAWCFEGDPEGWLTAEEALDYIQAYLEE